METIFPKSHYNIILADNYNMHPQILINSKEIDNDNKTAYAVLTHLANEVTNNDMTQLLEKIADNYESYYLSGKKQCLDATICGTLFPEYTESVTNNPSFKDGLDHWIQNNELYSPAVGKIEFLPVQETVNIELSANTPNSSNNSLSSLDLYQIKILENDNIDDYFLYFDLDEAYGGSNGGGLFGGSNSSGFSGAYACYKDIDQGTIGCLAWSDHTNKFDLAWGPAEHSLESSKTFYNTRFNNVVRRVRPNAEQFAYTIHLGGYTKTYLPEIYNRKNEIKSIEYGLFTTEFRNQQNGCYFCEAKIKANEINLLKVRND